MSGNILNLINPTDIPQNPFLPEQPNQGPAFLDTQACLCALQTSPEANSNQILWQCIGNQTEGVYQVTSGKWFKTAQGQQQQPAESNATKAPIDDASNPPDTANPLIFNSGTFQPSGDAQSLSVYDRACTGVNRTSFSTSYYRAGTELARNETPVDAAPCWRRGAIPITIQNVTSWGESGCNEGFLCANNTVNCLPQFCPPLTECQKARLGGFVCAFNGSNFGMGPFEPVVCRQGNYCPPGGAETLPCPKGSYCQPGASSPTPCAVGALCPEGSVSQRQIIPFVLLIIIDVLLILTTAILALRKRLKKRDLAHGIAEKPSSTQGSGGGAGGLMRTLTTHLAGYRSLPDEREDHEMMRLHHPARQDTSFMGFQAALEMQRHSYVCMDNLEDSGLTPQLRAFVESMRKATDANRFGLSFSYADLSFQPKGTARPILQNVTGSIERGSLVAVMGGSGAGKSTFVNVLMGKTRNTGGSVMVNNMPGKIQRYKKLIGYVPQDDIVLPELTVYENIVHSAKIRLPRTWSTHDIEAHVNSVIDCLELSHVRDSLVGSVGKPVISGGQRKRVSIGMELAAAPMAIFLDEPTSGLDATAASSIMSTLKALARLGISVIVIIHQPRMEIFEMLDDLILLANGQIIYEGPEQEVQPFFETLGFHFPEHSNWGDVVTDIITGNGRHYKPKGDISKEALISHWTNSRHKTDRADKRASTTTTSATNSSDSLSRQRTLLKQRGAPRPMQALLCLRRAMLQQWRQKSAFWFEMTLAAVAGFLLGLAQNGKQGVLFVGMYRAPYDVLSIATDVKSVPQLALLTAIAVGLVAGAPGVRVFSEEMLLHRREAEAGHSRVAYYVAKVVSAFPRMVFACFHFSTLVLLLSVPIIDWQLAFLANLLYFYCIYGIASIVSMVVRREDAPLIATMIALIVGILSGAAPPLSKAKEWHLEWLWRSSPGVWLAEIYFGQIISPFAYLYDVDMASQATGYHLHWLWRNMLVLLGIGTLYRVIAFIGLFAGKRLRL